MLNIFNQSKDQVDENANDLIIGGLLVEAASIDGEILDIEIAKIKESLHLFSGIDKETSDKIIHSCLEKVDEPNSFHYYTSKINREFNKDRKIKLLEILWRIVLSDGKIHDYESNLIRRIAGLLYISDVDCGNAKKRAIQIKTEDNQ